ncbi:hypothetical protein D8B22_05915 [Verminephrobacter aporrectodeae subsp. tuberculatae]|uniref:cysteine dioxygenase family protein n=1 Tax=Verminephrobacter aporrectodeae TaxID=1110389 RepID=UPI0022380E3F|nr:cysteine dioxygenase family protein [Verminephrobacter aporrectodeae]MCW5257621.1 hypothetical protein [Verminephrobacter aporrectodeae subsp. tuberculatae]MCW8166884.1 hypothetical protein [Verminephrobacter aporrectodeae subsp. tuberculatae]MCW8168659.1 hypothetical protein [Verminephrobacter aporrectodeae subsp. tuberculatae]MCW8207283.1 hypothetical protein [Verminephrobacter aporrectodeae subsp. tuberculatae]
MDQRQEIVSRTLQTIRQIARNGVTQRPVLDQILQQLLGLAAQKDLWTGPGFAPPTGAELQARYLIEEQPDQTFALYLNVMRAGKRILPHNHTTWACVAAVEGVEHNHLYRRLDDGSRPGYAKLEQTATLPVCPGSGVALLPDEIHAVEIRDAQLIRHLHLYGRALETLSERLCFDLANDSCQRMPIGVQTRR